MCDKDKINFGEDLNPDPDLRIFFSDSSPLRDWAKLKSSMIYQKIVDESG